MYPNSNIFHEPAIDRPDRISGLKRLLEGAPVLHDSKLLWHCTLETLLDGTRDGSTYPSRGRLRPETKINSRTVQSNRRAGQVERSNVSHGNVDSQRRE